MFKPIFRGENRLSKHFLSLVFSLFLIGNAVGQCFVVSNASNPVYNGTYVSTGFLNSWGFIPFSNGSTFMHTDGSCWYLSSDPFNVYDAPTFYYDMCAGNAQTPALSDWYEYDIMFGSYSPVSIGISNCPDSPSLTKDVNQSCVGAPVVLTATGNLIQGENWYWYEGSNCTGNAIGSGASITVNPTTSTNYFCRAENAATNYVGLCSSISLTVVTNSPSIFLNTTPVICTTPRTITSASLHLLAFDNYGNSCGLANNTNGFIDLKINGNSVFNTNLPSMSDLCGSSFNFPITNLNQFVEGNNNIALVVSDGINYLSQLGWAYLTVNYSDGTSLPVDITWDASFYSTYADLCNNWTANDVCWSQGFPTEITASFFNATVQLGNVTASVFNGLSPYQYTWTASNGGDVTGLESALFLSNVPAGNYNLSITDACNNISSESIQVTQITGPSISNDLTVQPTCGLSNGSVSVNIDDLCGVPTTLWTSVPAGLIPAGQENSLSLTDLPIGQYTLTVTDNNGSAVYVVSLNGTNPVSANPFIVQPSCPSFGTDGAIYPNLIGGNQPFSYSWTTVDGSIPSFYETEPSLYNGLTAGTYTVVVTDICNDQVYNESFVLTTPNGPVVTTSFTQSPTCAGGSDGIASVDIQNACGTLNVIGWNSVSFPAINGTIDTYVNNLPAGTYTFTAADNNGTTVHTVVIGNPSTPETLTVTGTVFPVVCNTPLTVTNVEMIYHYRNQVAGNTSCGSVGADGNWDLSVNGSLIYSGLVQATSECGEVDTLDLTTQMASLIIDGSNDFELNVVNPINGGGVADWGWSYLRITTSNNETTTVLLSGNFSFMDYCSNPFQSYSGLCATNGGVGFNPSPVNSVINLNLGGIVITDVEGGTWPISYDWTGPNSFSSTSSELLFVPEGIYNLTIEDACGQIVSESFTIGAPNGPVVGFPEFEIPSCPTSNDGALAVFVLDAGPCGPNVLTWTASNGGVVPAGQENDEELIGIPAGTYTVSATNANGTTTQTYVLEAPTPSPLSVNVVADQIACAGTTNKQVSEIKLEWYAANNDLSSFAFIINGDTIVETDADPTDQYNCLGYVGTYTTSNPQDLATIQSGVNHFEFNASSMSIYAYARAIIKFNDNSQQNVVLVQPENGSIGQSGFILCDYGVQFGQDWDTSVAVQLGTGAALVLAEVTGGTPGYQYLWNNNATLAGVYAGTVGNYSVTVTDACGVTATAQTNVSIDYTPAPATPNVVSTAATCTSAGTSSVSNYNATLTYEFTPSGPVMDANGNITGMIFGANYTLTAANPTCASEPTISFVNNDVLETPSLPIVSSTDGTCEADGVSSVTNFNPNVVYVFTPAGPSVSNDGTIQGLISGVEYSLIASTTACQSPATEGFFLLTQLTSPVIPVVNVTVPTCEIAGFANITNYDASVTYTFSPTGPTISASGEVQNATFGTSYTVSASNQFCSSTFSEAFSVSNVTTINTAVTVNDNVLTATQTGATYQWFNCANNQAISGATGISYTATANGNYRVQITLNGCVAQSECAEVTTLGQLEKTEALILAYPNPTNDVLNVVGLLDFIGREYTLMDQLGRKIITGMVEEESLQLSLGDLPTGIYTFRLVDSKSTFKVIKQ
jgi:hypothetical protein